MLVKAVIEPDSPVACIASLSVNPLVFKKIAESMKSMMCVSFRSWLPFKSQSLSKNWVPLSNGYAQTRPLDKSGMSFLFHEAIDLSLSIPLVNITHGLVSL